MKEYPSHCGFCRPGGMELTIEGIRLAGVREKGRVLDVGCGEGRTVSFLREKGFEAYGVDPRADADLSFESGALLKGYAEQLPFPDRSFDAVLFECVLSDIRMPDKALREAARVLKEGGSLILSDLYARKEPGFAGVRLESAAQIRSRMKEAGLLPLEERDHSDRLLSFFGQLLMDGRKDVLREGGLDEAALKKAGCGYILMTAVKQ